MEMINSSFFVQLGDKGLPYVLQWCVREKLIASQNTCPKCNGDMTLTQRKDIRDGFEWMCRKSGGNSHVCKRSVRSGSFFSRSRCDILQILRLTYLWIMKANRKLIINDLGLTARTVTDWMVFYRELCIELMITDNEPLGGEGVIVDIIETTFGKGKLKKMTGKWVFAGAERGSTRTFFKVVENPCKEVLLDIVKTYIIPGSIVTSGCWKTYHCLEDNSFRQIAVEHSLSFKDVDKGDNFAGSLWNVFRRNLPRHTCRDQVDAYLAEYMWRRKHRNEDSQKVIRSFFEGVTKIYRMPEKNEVARVIDGAGSGSEELQLLQ